MNAGATVLSGDEAARTLAVRLTAFFEQSGWDAVADPARDPEGRPVVEIRSGEPLGPIPGRLAPHRARVVVEPGRLEEQFEELTQRLRTGRLGAPGSGRFTTRPVLPAWCQAD